MTAIRTISPEGRSPGVFIIGCPRSGTSVFSWALAAHPNFWTSAESDYLADLFGRKHTLLAGAAFCGVGHSLLLVADGFWGLAVFEVALAIGHSLVSGADIALLYDTELALDRGEQEQR